MGQVIVLASHGSATKLAKVQRELVKEFKKRACDHWLRHVNPTAQLEQGARKEGRQRSRSFLFASQQRAAN